MEVFKNVFKKVILTKFDKIQRKTLRKGLQHQCFSMNFCGILKNIFSTEVLRATATVHGNVTGQTWFLDVVVLKIFRK